MRQRNSQRTKTARGRIKKRTTVIKSVSLFCVADRIRPRKNKRDLMHSSKGTAQRLFRQITQSLLLMVILAFGLRVAGILILRTYNFPTKRGPFATTPAEFGFGSESGSIAGSLARGQGFSSPFGYPTGPTAWIAPVYPSLVAVIFKSFGIYTRRAAIAALSLNSLFSALTCIPIVLVGSSTVGYWDGLLAGWFWAVVPLY